MISQDFCATIDWFPPEAAEVFEGQGAIRNWSMPLVFDEVVPALREVLEESWPYDVDALTVVDGAMDAHSQFVAAHLRFGDRVAVEQPCFPPLLDLLEMAGAVPIGVGYDAEGLVVADLAAAMKAGAKVLFFQPWGQNPSGQSLSRARAPRRRSG